MKKYSLALTIIMHHDHVPIQRCHFVERFVTVVVVAVVDQLTINTEWFAVLLSLMSNEVVLAEKCLVAVLVLTHEILAVILSCGPAPTR